MDQKASDSADDIYLIDPDSDITINFKTLQENAIKISQHLVALGYKKNTSIAFASSNHIHLVQVILGLLYGGFRVVSINLVAGHATISYVLSHSDCALVLCDHDNYPIIKDITKQQKTNINLLKIDDILAIDPFHHDNHHLHSLQPCDDGLLIYTSGTTGTPKGVMLSHANLIAGGKNTIDAHKLTKKDKALCSLPLYHINAFCVSMMACLLSGQTMVVSRKFSASNFWHIIHRYQCSWFSLVPTQISYIMHHAHYQDFDPQLSASIRFGRSAIIGFSTSFAKRFLKKNSMYILSKPWDYQRRLHKLPLTLCRLEKEK